MVPSRIAYAMVLESITSTMVTYTKECGVKTKDTVRVSTTIKMEKSTVAITDRDRERVSVLSITKMEIGTKVNGKTETLMASGPIIIVSGRCIWAIIKIIREMARVGMCTRME